MFQPSYHVARFVLIGLYTGTRHEANLNMRWGVNSKGWFDLDHGVMYRRGEGEIDTNKRRVPAPIPDRLLPHLKRWRRITVLGPVEYAGRLIAKERKGWDRARELAGLGENVTPHVLKHTFITWLLQNRVPIWEVAGFVGTSEKVIRDTYGHHSPDNLNAARTGFSGQSEEKLHGARLILLSAGGSRLVYRGLTDSKSAPSGTLKLSFCSLLLVRGEH